MIRWRLVWPAGCQAGEVGIGFLGHDTFKHPFLEAEIPGIHSLGFVIGRARSIAPYRDCTEETLGTAIGGQQGLWRVSRTKSGVGVVRS